MNRTEVQEHVRQSGQDNILIALKVKKYFRGLQKL